MTIDNQPPFGWRCYELWQRGLNTQQITRLLSEKDSTPLVTRVYAELYVWNALSAVRKAMRT